MLLKISVVFYLVNYIRTCLLTTVTIKDYLHTLTICCEIKTPGCLSVMLH